MSSSRILLSFKDNSEDERKIVDFLNSKGKIIGRGAYIKSLLQKEMEKENKYYK